MPRRLLIVVTAEVADSALRDLVRSRGGADADMLVVAPASSAGPDLQTAKPRLGLQAQEMFASTRVERDLEPSELDPFLLPAMLVDVTLAQTGSSARTASIRHDSVIPPAGDRRGKSRT